MSSSAFLQLVCLFSVGLSLLLTGVVCILFGAARRSIRIGLSFVLSSFVLAGSWLLTEDRALVAQSAGLIAAGLIPSVLFGSTFGTRLGSVLFRMLRQSQLRWVGVSLLGATIAIGSMASYERDEKEKLDRAMIELGDLGHYSPFKVASQRCGVTDRGSEVPFQEPIEPKSLDENDPQEAKLYNYPPLQYQLIRNQPANNRCNCHGWAFTGGQFWVRGEDVELILTENEYRPVDQPRPGDLVIYRENQVVTHTGLVRYVTEGLPVMAEGKWGTNGVYLHPVDRSCYGTQFTYYRSPRSGHVLRGLEQNPQSAASD